MIDFQLHNLINDDQFEELIKALYNCEFKTTTFQRFGRNGQKQFGVDIYSVEKKILIQCKYKGDITDYKKVSSKLKKEIIESVQDSLKENSPWRNEIDAFEEFIIISTFHHDAKLQIFANHLKNKEGNKYPINISYKGRQVYFEMIKRHFKEIKGFLPEAINDLFKKRYINSSFGTYDSVNFLKICDKPRFVDNKFDQLINRLI